MVKKNFLISALIIISVFFLEIKNSNAQQGISGIHGSFQTDIQYYQRDSSINAPDVPEKVLANSFLNLVYSSEKFSAGIRYESFLNALQGYDKRYEGNSFLFRYASYTNDGLEVTAGNFYEQFGYGLIFRSYNEWGLGYDNAMDGIRAKYTILNGIQLKGFIGKQRSFFDYGPGIVRGFDAELNFNETFKSLQEKKTKIILGGSLVSKYQRDDDPLYILPQNVSATAGRLTLTHGGFSFGSEFGYKINDPSADNNLIYKDGNALYVTASYSKKLFGVSVSAKRIDNMSFRSDRTAILNDLALNFLPAINKQHTYRLATLYPYATQPNGEIGGQAEVFYSLKPESSLGGKFGTTITLGASAVNDIAKNSTNNDYGYTSDYFETGDTVFYNDISVEISRKLSKKSKLILTGIYQKYNKEIVEGLEGKGTVYATIGIAELQYKITAKKSMRVELQHLYTKQDKQSWAMGLLEYSISPHWFFAVFDEYNYGNDDKDHRIHYFSASMGYTKGVTRITLGYGRQREGLLCVGGVCRNVPASNGFSLGITSSF